MTPSSILAAFVLVNLVIAAYLDARFKTSFTRVVPIGMLLGIVIALYTR